MESAKEQEICRACAEEHNFNATRNLAIEILCQIFKGVLVDFESGYSLYVIYVCHTWRSAALDDPHLWTDLRRVTACNADLARKLISCSKGLPVDISYSFYQYDDDSDPLPSAQQALDLISDPNRFRTLYFKYCNQDFLNLFTYPTPPLSRILCRYPEPTMPPNFLAGLAESVWLRFLEHTMYTNEVLFR